MARLRDTHAHCNSFNPPENAGAADAGKALAGHMPCRGPRPFSARPPARSEGRWVRHPAPTCPGKTEASADRLLPRGKVFVGSQVNGRAHAKCYRPGT